MRRKTFGAAATLLAAAALTSAQQPPAGGAKPPVRPGGGQQFLPPNSPKPLPGPVANRPNDSNVRPPAFNQGQIVNANAQAGTLTLRTGTGAQAREQQFRVGKDTRFFGADRRALGNGLRFDGFRAGANVWFRAGAGDLANSINDLRLFDPASPIMAGKFQSGQIVSVSAADGIVTIRTGSGANVREERFRISEATRFFGSDLLALNDGLAFNGFRNGANVWFAPGEQAGTIAGLSLGDPTIAAAEGRGAVNPAEEGPAPAAENVPGTSERFLRGVIVVANPKSGAITLRMGAGANEREMDFTMSPDARYFGADRQPVTGGLAFRAFRAGADVWFMTQTGDLTGNIIDIRLYQPVSVAAAGPMAPMAPEAGAAGSPMPDAAKSGSRFVDGKVVSFDAESRTINILVGEGEKAREESFRVASDAEFFGPERQPLSEGLKYSGMKPGVHVWMRVGTGDLAKTVRDLRMYDPGKTPEEQRGEEKPKRDDK